MKRPTREPASVCPAGGGGARALSAPLQMLPVRCYTCNSVIAHRHAEYVARTSSGETNADALAAIGIVRLCCRRMFLGYVDLTTEQMRYANVDAALDEAGTTLRRETRGEHVVPCD